MVSHDSREEFVDLPLHLTFHLIEGLPNLRNKREHATLIEVFARCREREGFRITQYSIQGNHVHLIVEARRKEDLTRGVTGLATSMARRLNKLWNRHGRVFSDRFHSRVLRSPTEVLRALRYVFHNAHNHGIWLWDDRPDPYPSSSMVGRTTAERIGFLLALQPPGLGCYASVGVERGLSVSRMDEKCTAPVSPRPSLSPSASWRLPWAECAWQAQQTGGENPNPGP